MFAAQAITAALFARERTGRGQAVDIAMLDSVAALLSYQAGIYFATGTPPGRLGNRHPTIVPYETFSASDGEFVLAVGNDDQWRRFCAVAGIAEEERFATNRQRVLGIRRAEAARRVKAGRRAARLLDRAADGGRRAVRIGARISTSCFPIRRSPRARWWPSSSTRPSERCACSARRLKLSDTAGVDPDAAADASASTPMRC